MLRPSIAALAVLVACGLSGPALASGFACDLQTVTTSKLEGGVSSTKTAADETVTFAIAQTSDDSAVIDGTQYAVTFGKGYLKFRGPLHGAIEGTDIITIYDRKVSGAYYTVEARQAMIVGTPQASQLVGTCSPTG